MTRIQVLSPDVAQKIAAGEVVERPASVVKELVENSLDAGAHTISVEVRQAGLKLIRVSDDGEGMDRRDASLALTRYATSKIRTAADLEGVDTLGFRGEALSSIAAVARVEILSRVEGEIEGSRVQGRSDETSSELSVEPAASPVGTSVTVRDLFYNTPARRKFIKSPARETELIRKTVIRYALAYPRVAFRLVVDRRERLVAPPARPLERIGLCLGRQVAGEMLEIGWQAGDLRVDGYISGPGIGRSRRAGQFFYLNGRPIRSGLLAVMLERPYAGRLQAGRYPLAVVHIHLDPHLVDVNVHPRKAEVRFAQERAIYQALSQAVKEALAPFPVPESLAAWEWPFSDAGPDRLGEERAEYAVGGGLKSLGQMYNTYLVAASQEGLVVVDQHAAHEQVLYERLSAGAESEPLSPPVRLDLKPRQAETLQSALPLLEELGFEIEPFGGDNSLLRAVPAPIAELPAADDWRRAMGELIAELGRGQESDPDGLREEAAMKAACLGAVKAGDYLSPDEQQRLLDDLMRAWSPATCPHGRPAFVILSRQELERRFLR